MPTITVEWLLVLALSVAAPARGEEPLAKLKHPGAVRALDFSPDGRILATVCQDDRAVRLWEPTTGKAVTSIAAPHGADFVAFSPDEKLLVFGGLDSTIYLWDCVAGKEYRRLQGHGKVASCATFSPDGKRLASGGEDATIRLWDVATGKEVAQFKEPDKVNALAFSPNGQWLASVGWSYPVHLWDIAAAKVVRECPGHRAPVIAVAFSPDGSVLATGSQDGTARLWEVRSGKEIYEIDNHLAQVNGVAFSPDGRFLGSAGGDRTVMLWQTVWVREVWRFTHAGPVNAVAFSADGRLLATGCVDTLARIWAVKEIAIPQPPKSGELSKKLLESHWKRLAHSNPRTAYLAIWRLSEAPAQTIPLFQEHLLPLAASATLEQMTQLLTELNADQFAAREKATKELVRLGELAEPSLRKTLTGKLPSLEARRRTERILEQIQANKVDGSSADVLRAMRAVTVMEWIGTPEARQILEKLARGMPDAPLTRDARSALQRLAKRR